MNRIPLREILSAMSDPVTTSEIEQFKEEYGHWGEHPDFPVQDWQAEVQEGETRLGYWEWVYCSFYMIVPKEE